MILAQLNHIETLDAIATRAALPTYTQLVNALCEAVMGTNDGDALLRMAQMLASIPSA